MRSLLLVVPVLSLLAAAPPVAQRTDGFVPFYWEEGTGKIYLEVKELGREFLYVTSLPAGLGSNDIGLDRGTLGHTYLARWEKSGNKVLLVAGNTGYRADSQDAAERKAVRDSFAESVLWGFEVVPTGDSRVLVDATAFLLRDAVGAGDVIQRAKQGAYRADASRSAFYLARTKAFPKNTEIEATVTLTGGPAGGWLASVTPAPESVTLRMHHSFVELPEAGYAPLKFDPRSGFFARGYADYASPLSRSVAERGTPRHRLAKGGTIRYYLDPGAPEPIRSALLEGARWWNQAFEAAGYPNGFQVELLPEGVDPMDLRYNMIHWVHRATRGWSFGASVVDPRTGEILKGNVTLGSLRARQDYLIAEAFLAPYEDGKAESPAMKEMVLARIRQLAAHEVGHTLGLGHNYIASTKDRASVMDYPHPYITLKGGVPDLSDAYAKGIGAWDKVSIDWGYGVHTDAERERILREAEKKGLVFLTDQDARPAGSAHPEVHLWDSGSNAVDELERFLKVRAAALERFGERNVKPGEPLALLEDVLVPLYLSHRYQTEAVVKTVGGLRYRYALRGDGQAPTTAVSAAEQRRALKAVLETLQPKVLLLPERVSAMIPPRPAGYSQTRELMPGRTGLTFDAVGAAESAAGMVLEVLLNAERATRLEQQHAASAGQLGLEEMLEQVWTALLPGRAETGMAGEVRQAVFYAALRQVMNLAASGEASGAARAQALASLERLRGRVDGQKAFGLSVLRQLDAFAKDPKDFRLPKAQEPPPGMPIGDGCEW